MKHFCLPRLPAQQISRLYRRLPFHSACAKICRMLPDVSEHKVMSRIPALVLFLAVGVSSLSAKDVPFQVLTWPESGQPVLRFTFSKLKEIGAMRTERTYITE